jgi:NAD(P)-dependent dehydrogenase (short-subunit alcohol dehydrogenase family)
VAGLALQGKRALVTGASRGIGRAIACAFAAEGAAVAVGGRDVGRTAAVTAEIGDRGATAVACPGDVGEEASAAQVVDAAVRGLGGLDVVVNNAGVIAPYERPLHEWEAADFDDVLRTNLRGPFLVTRCALPHLLAGGGGVFLHVSSVAAVTVWAGEVAYGVAKGGLNMLSHHVAVEYGAHGIRSNTLLPGSVRTEAHEAALARAPDRESVERELLALHPVGRFADVDEIARTAVFLCSDQAPFLTGADVRIDGGYALR